MSDYRDVITPPPGMSPSAHPWSVECELGTCSSGHVGAKHDAGKLPWDLLPWVGTEQIVRVLEYGARKYGPQNWRKVEMAERRYFAAALRHLVAHARGEKLDPESGLPHLAHAACSMLFLLENT